MKGKPGLKIEARRWWAGRRKTGAVDLSKPSVRFDGNKVSFHEVISFRWKKKREREREREKKEKSCTRASNGCDYSQANMFKYRFFALFSTYWEFSAVNLPLSD